MRIDQTIYIELTRDNVAEVRRIAREGIAADDPITALVEGIAILLRDSNWQPLSKKRAVDFALEMSQEEVEALQWEFNKRYWLMRIIGIFGWTCHLKLEHRYE
jgi:hypothetical protein